MDEVLRAQLRKFQTEQTLGQLEALVKATLRSGQGVLDFYDPLTRYTLELGSADRETAQKGVVYPTLLPSALANIAGLYEFVRGNNHPWKQCKIFQIQSMKLQEPGAVFTLEGSDDEGGRNILVEFFTFLRALEPFPLRPYSKMLMVHLAERAVWADRNGWEEKDHPEILTRAVKALEVAPYNTKHDRLRAVLATLAAFSTALEQADPDLDDEDSDNWFSTHRDFYYQVENGQMSEIHHILEVVETALEYVIEPDPITGRYSAIRTIADTMKETGLYTWCDSTVEEIETWVDRYLVPRIVIDAASSLNA